MRNQYIYKSATELASLIRMGKASSSDIVREHLEQIKLYNEGLNALISIFEQEALHEADLCDKEAREGNFRGSLHGVPVTIKEQFWIKGKNSNTNFKRLKDFIAPEDAVIVDRIKRSGAIILGQTNVPKSLIDYQVSGDIYPQGKNPYNKDHSPGGSTGGGAAALAAGFTPLELGGDFGGSIRVPSNFCGLYGLKTTENTIPFHGNIPIPENSDTFIVHMAVAGPLARNLDDIELLWRIIVGPHESDRNIPDVNWKEPSDKSIKDYKIAWTDGWPDYETSSQISDAIKSFAGKLKDAGCKLEKTIPDETLHKDSLKAYVGIFPYVIAQGTPRLVRAIIKMQLRAGLLKGIKKVAPDLNAEMNEGFKLRANHYGRAMLQRSIITKRWELFFKDFDFLICPVAYGPSFKSCKTGNKIKYEGKEVIYLKYVWPYNACFNVSGNPSLAIPLGIGKEGLPIGVQVVSKHWNEPELIRFAKEIAALTEGFIKPNGY